MKKKDSRKFKILEVTITKEYIIEMYDDERTHINGWTMEEIVEDWFKKYPIDSHHASREGSQIFGSSKFISSRVIDLEK